jgi:toxin ParE1/3/4
LRVILTRAALHELDETLGYIAERSPQGAQRVKAMVWSRIELLGQHPLAGHTTNRQGLRRVLALPYPYAIFYRVSDEAIIVQSIRHTARRP